MNEVKTQKQRLKELNAQRKALLAEQRQLRESMKKEHEHSKAVREGSLETRKEVKLLKATFRDEAAKILPAVKNNDIELLNKLADSVVEVAADLAKQLREFATLVENDSKEDVDDSENDNEQDDLDNDSDDNDSDDEEDDLD